MYSRYGNNMFELHRLKTGIGQAGRTYKVSKYLILNIKVTVCILRDQIRVQPRQHICKVNTQYNLTLNCLSYTHYTHNRLFSRPQQSQSKFHLLQTTDSLPNQVLTDAPFHLDPTCAHDNYTHNGLNNRLPSTPLQQHPPRQAPRTLHRPLLRRLLTRNRPLGARATGPRARTARRRATKCWALTIRFERDG